MNKHNSGDMLEMPEIVVTPRGNDLVPLITIANGFNRFFNHRGTSTTAVYLSENPFLISEDAPTIVLQLAKNTYYNCRKPRIAAAMAFESFKNGSGHNRIRLVLAMMLDGGTPNVQYDTEWFALPKGIWLEEDEFDNFSPYLLWVKLVEHANSNHVERIEQMVSRAYRDLSYRNRSYTHTQQTAAAYD